MPTVISETLPHAGGFVVSEANGWRSRDRISIASGAIVRPGEVLGKQTATGHYVAWNPSAVDGTETASAIAYGHIDATAAVTPGPAVVRDAEVSAANLVWPSDATDPQKAAATADLAAIGIIAR